MATTTKPRQRQHRNDDEVVEFSAFGERWQSSHWMAPIASWFLVLLVAAGINLMQRYGHLPTGGATFIALCVAITCVFAFVGLTIGGREDMHPWVAGWCTAMPLLGGAWSTFCALYQLNNGLAPMLSWLVLGLVLTALFRHMRDIQRKYELALIYDRAEQVTDAELAAATAHLAAAQSGPVDQDKKKWEEWTDAAGLPGMIFWGRHALKNGSGFMLHYEVPDDGSISYEMVVSHARKLEVMLFKQHRGLFHKGQVRPGCVRIEPATDDAGQELVGELFISIDVVDVLAKTLRMPTGKDQYTPISITQAFPVGRFVDGTPIYLTIHEIHTLIVGQTQHGKSNLLHVIIRQLARCNDALLWGLDFKGGDTLRLWINPYMDREIDPNTGRPLAQSIFDWVAADNPLEAERILLAALEAAKRRPAIVRGGGWVPTQQNPAIIILADEISEVVGATGGPGGRGAFYVSSDVLSQLLTRLMKLGTGMGIYVITTSQRGTVGNVGSGDAKSQQKGRILLPVTGGGNASDVLEGSGPEARRLAASLVHKGSVVIEGWGATEGKKGKIWLAGYKPEIKEKIRDEVMMLTHLRSQMKMDEGTKKFILQYGYETRMGGPTPDPDRMAWYYGEEPKRPLIAWDYRWVDGHDDPVHISKLTPAQAGATATMTRPTSTAAALGLDDVESVFTNVERPAPVSDVTVNTAAPRQAQSGDVTAEWAAREAELLAELGLDEVAKHVAATPELNPAPGDHGRADEQQQLPLSSAAMPQATAPQQYVKPTYENTMDDMIKVIRSSGSAGATGAVVLRGLGDRAPHRSTIYQWLGRLVLDTARNPDARCVVPVGDVFMTKDHQPMPTSGI